MNSHNPSASRAQYSLPDDSHVFAPGADPSGSEIARHFDDEREFKKLVHSLHGIIHDLHVHPSQACDLLQLALFHFWRKLLRRPSQKRCWYLQSCKYFLQHCIRRNRRDLAFCQTQRATDEELQEAVGTDDSLFPNIVARDIRRVLLASLHGPARRVFRYLALGLRVGEIAKRIQCTHQNVSKYVSEVAATAISIGITRLPK